MPFFGPGGLSGAMPQETSGLDPQLIQALMAQFPGLQSLTGQGGQQPSQNLQGLGYQWAGPSLYPGQGAGAFQLSPFESAGGSAPESITGGLAQGTYGKSGTQSPVPNTGQGSSLLSLPSLSLPMAQVASMQGGYGGGEQFGPSEPAQETGGFTVSAGDVLDVGQQALNLFGGTNLGTQTTTPGYAEQRAGERADYTGGRDLSTLGGSFLGGLQGSQLLAPSAPIGGFLGLPQDTTFSTLQGGDLLTSPSSQFSMAPGTTFSMPDAGETMMAPGGSAQTAFGQPAPQGDLLGGGLSTLQGLYNLYGGAQTGDIGQLLGGAGGTLGGLGQMAPETLAALSESLGLGAGGLGLAAGGLGGLAGAYGLYQGIQQGDPMQAVMGAGGLYAGAAPLVNAAFGTTLPTLSSLGSSALSALGGGAGAGAAGATGASAGAAAGGLGAGLTAGIALAPIAGGFLGGSIENMIDAEREMRRERARQQQFQRGLPTMAQDLVGSTDLLARLRPDTSDADLLSIYNELTTDARNWEGGSGGVNFPSMLGGMQGEGRATQEQLAPYLMQLELGRLRAEDLMTQRGLTIPGGGVYGDPRMAAKLLGGATSAYDPESGSFLGQGAYRSTNPWMQANYLQPSAAAYQQQQAALDAQIAQAKEAFGPDWEGAVAAQRGTADARAIDPRGISAWSPEASQAFAGIQPGTMESSLRQLLGLPAPMYGYAPQVGTERYGALNLPTFGGLEEPQRQFQAYQQAQDAYAQQLQQFTQQMGGLTQQAPQLLQAAQTSLQGAPMSSIMGGGQPGAPGFAASPQGGGGVDLMALLRQLGYAA